MPNGVETFRIEKGFDVFSPVPFLIVFSDYVKRPSRQQSACDAPLSASFSQLKLPDHPARPSIGSTASSYPGVFAHIQLLLQVSFP